MLFYTLKHEYIHIVVSSVYVLMYSIFFSTLKQTIFMFLIHCSVYVTLVVGPKISFQNHFHFNSVLLQSRAFKKIHNNRCPSSAGNILLKKKVTVSTDIKRTQQTWRLHLLQVSQGLEWPRGLYLEVGIPRGCTRRWGQARLTRHLELGCEACGALAWPGNDWQDGLGLLIDPR